MDPHAAERRRGIVVAQDGHGPRTRFSTRSAAQRLHDVRVRGQQRALAIDRERGARHRPATSFLDGEQIYRLRCPRGDRLERPAAKHAIQADHHRDDGERDGDAGRQPDAAAPADRHLDFMIPE